MMLMLRVLVEWDGTLLYLIMLVLDCQESTSRYEKMKLRNMNTDENMTVPVVQRHSKGRLASEYRMAFQNRVVEDIGS